MNEVIIGHINDEPFTMRSLIERLNQLVDTNEITGMITITILPDGDCDLFTAGNSMKDWKAIIGALEAAKLTVLTSDA